MADAGFGGWGEGTAGSEHNDPRLSHEEFKPVNPKTVTPEQHSQHVMNVAESFAEATPHERRAGARFYSRAHRDATHVGLRLNPGMQPYGGVGSERPGHERMSPAQVSEHVAHPEHFEESTRRGAGAIAALSPSSPAGMDWEHNPTAAYQTWGLTTEHMANFHEADEKLKVQQRAAGELKSMKNSGGSRSEIRDAQRTADQAKGDYRTAAVRARAPLEGTATNKAGGKAIIRAHQILSGEHTPEEVLPMAQKTGHFYRSIADPNDPDAATVDGRSHDIATGTRLPWDSPRGLQAKGRYAYFADVHRDARDIVGAKTASHVQATSWIHDKNVMSSGASDAMKAIGMGTRRRGS